MDRETPRDPLGTRRPTDLDNLCLLCDHHHDRIDTGGWQITMRDGVPWFTPPTWLDPTQTPRRNHRATGQ